MKIVADTNIPFVKECFSSIGQVEIVSGRDMTPEIVADADALLVRSITKVNKELLEESNVKFVGTATIGIEHVDIDYLNSRSIGFASAPGSNANSVAEYLIAALLEVADKYNITLKGRSIGIIGVGNVGSRVETKCGALGMIPVLNDPPLHRRTGDEKFRPIEELYECDFITMHTPLTYMDRDKTFHLGDKKFFNYLKDGVVFINTSRGGVVETAAMKNALKTGKIKSAVLDVWENEPDIDTDLLEMVDIGTPHIAGYSYDGKVAGMIMIYNALCDHFKLQPKHTIEDFLPEPKLPELEISSDNVAEQNILQKAVSTVYDITADDKNLRQILDLPQGKRCATFDRLRKEYPIRREFQNTNIILNIDKQQAPSASAGIKNKSTENLEKELKGIGFKIE